jgi:hypothetical protein
MKKLIKTAKVINIIALFFLIFIAYGLPITGALQLLAAFIYLLLFPKNKLIHIYFGFVFVFFLFWDYNTFNWLFLIPFSLIILLTYIIHFQKNKS